MCIQELKKEIRKLRKIKKELRVGSEERRQVNKRLKDLKVQCVTLERPDDRKAELIDQLTKLYQKLNQPILVDFRNFSSDQLSKRLENLTKGRRYF